jgi:ribosome-associated protein
LSEKKAEKNIDKNDFYKVYQPLVDALLDKHAIEVTVHDLSEVSGFTETFIVAIARSDLHARTLRDTTEEFLDKNGLSHNIEGENSSKWCLMDAGHLVINILSKEGSDYYRLDSLWGDAPVKKFNDPDAALEDNF